jgi:hydroxyacylglutathione hydrolase
MKIQQFRYAADNLGYLIYGKSRALVIDGGAVEAIIDFAARQGLSIQAVTHTHRHPDHTVGISELLARSGATYLDPDFLLQNPIIAMEDETIEVLATPGHTRDSMTFIFDDVMVTGDTLFNGTVGNCFSGDLRAFFDSIERLMGYAPETRIYAGHDYVRYAMAFARLIEPDNADIEAYLEKYDPSHVVSTLADELKVNPYLRFNTLEMTNLLKQKKLPVDSAYDRWQSVMTLG